MSGALEQLFARYVSGNVSLPVCVLVDAHLEMSPANRHFVHGLEGLAGLSLEEAPPAPLRNRQAMLEAILRQSPEEAASVAEKAVSDDSRTSFPRPIAEYLQMDRDDVPWKKRLPGLWEYDIEDEGQHVSLIRVRAGRKMPAHTHDGQEITLVLQGSFSDAIGHYATGDIAIADESVDHQPIAGEEDECICFSVVDNPVRLTGPIGRLFNPFLRH